MINSKNKVRPDPFITETTFKGADTTIVVKLAMQPPELTAELTSTADGRANVKCDRRAYHKYTERHRLVLDKIVDAVGAILDEHALAMEGRPGMVPPDIEGATVLGADRIADKVTFTIGDSFASDSPRKRQERAQQLVADALKEPTK